MGEGDVRVEGGTLEQGRDSFLPFRSTENKKV